MNRRTRITFLLVMLSLLSIVAAGCSVGGGKAARTPELAVIHEEEFGGVYITLTIDDFNSSGFAFGDSIDIVFANFRNVRAGDIRPDLLYRSASPCDNQHNRAKYVNDLMEEAGIGFILNLADTDEKIEDYIAADYGSGEFRGKLANG